MPRRRKEPRLRRHASGQGTARDENGRDHYFGVWGDDPDTPRLEVRRAFEEWRVRYRLRQRGFEGKQVFHLIDAFVIEHGLVAGAKLDGHGCAKRKMAQHVLSVDRLALRPIGEIGPADLEMFLEHLASLTVEKTVEGAEDTVLVPRYTRATCNKLGALFKQAIRWGERTGIAPPGTLHRLSAAEQLKRGRTPARETDPVQPVPDADVESTLGALPAVVADMVRFQRLVGCRPGEVCRLRLADTAIETVEADGHEITVRLWTLRQHKTAHLFKRRVIAIGPKALLILQRRADGDESMVFRTPKGDGYTREAYTRAIARAANKAGVAHWAPNQLRHARATELNKLVGLETAGAVLGHERLDTTQIYAQKRTEAALRAAALTG